MITTQEIYEAIATKGFSPEVVAMIDNYSNDIENGRANISRYTLPEHAGVCTAGAVLIGATIVSDYARKSLTTGSDASGSQAPSTEVQLYDLSGRRLTKNRPQQGIVIKQYTDANGVKRSRKVTAY